MIDVAVRIQELCFRRHFRSRNGTQAFLKKQEELVKAEVNLLT